MTAEKRPYVPPRWFVVTAWHVHRALYRLMGGRALWRPQADKWGTLRLVTTGRRSGRERGVIVAYFEDGPNLVLMAMNGWAEGDPAWWLNLKTNPDAKVDHPDGPRLVRARAAKGTEHTRLWTIWNQLGKNMDDFVAHRATRTAVVVLEPRANKRD